VLSGRIAYTPDTEAWSIALYGTNLLDKRYTTSSVGHHFHLGAGGRNLRGGYLGRPRSLGVDVRVNF
jgi:outer membrane receptor protein involved in Fe transport